MNDCGAESKLSAPLIYLSKTGNYSYVSIARRVQRCAAAPARPPAPARAGSGTPLSSARHRPGFRRAWPSARVRHDQGPLQGTKREPEVGEVHRSWFGVGGIGIGETLALAQIPLA
jgi:hypothetical protein